MFWFIYLWVQAGVGCHCTEALLQTLGRDEAFFIFVSEAEGSLKLAQAVAVYCEA